MHKWLILISILWTAAVAEPAYRWVDENGQVHYSDRPIPGSTRIELIAGGAASAPRAQPSAAPATEPQAARDPAAAYQAFNILQPGQQETLWGTGGTVDVVVEISPALQPGHHLGYYLDGELTDLDSGATTFQMQDVFRGIHTLQAVILDDAGEEVLRSLAVTFMVQQTSINYPQNPNNPARARPSAPPAGCLDAQRRRVPSPPSETPRGHPGEPALLERGAAPMRTGFSRDSRRRWSCSIPA